MKMKKSNFNLKFAIGCLILNSISMISGVLFVYRYVDIWWIIWMLFIIVVQTVASLQIGFQLSAEPKEETNG